MRPPGIRRGALDSRARADRPPFFAPIWGRAAAPGSPEQSRQHAAPEAVAGEMLADPGLPLAREALAPRRVAQHRLEPGAQLVDRREALVVAAAREIVGGVGGILRQQRASRHWHVDQAAGGDPGAVGPLGEVDRDLIAVEQVGVVLIAA